MAETPPITTSSPTASPEELDHVSTPPPAAAERGESTRQGIPPQIVNQADSSPATASNGTDAPSKPQDAAQQTPAIQPTQEMGNVLAGSIAAAVAGVAGRELPAGASPPAPVGRVGGKFVSLKPKQAGGQIAPSEPAKAQPTALLNSPKPADDNELQPRDTRIGGLSDIPKPWKELPSNASLSQEIAWVQSERLRVVIETPRGGVKVDLSKARVPAPSMAALSWLETSIRSYAKFTDVAARMASTGTEEQDFVRKERMAIGEIRAILEEMQVDKQG